MKKFLLFLVCLFAMASCGKTEPNYEDSQNRQYNQYYDQFGITDIDKFYDMPEDTYGIYMYGVWCGYCDLCKGAVFDYLDDLKANKDKSLDNLYIFDRDLETDLKSKFKALPDGFNYTRDGSIYKKKMIGATSLTETYFFGTPALYVIEKGVLKSVHVDYKECGKYLTK